MWVEFCRGLCIGPTYFHIQLQPWLCSAITSALSTKQLKKERQESWNQRKATQWRGRPSFSSYRTTDWNRMVLLWPAVRVKQCRSETVDKSLCVSRLHLTTGRAFLKPRSYSLFSLNHKTLMFGPQQEVTKKDFVARWMRFESFQVVSSHLVFTVVLSISCIQLTFSVSLKMYMIICLSMTRCNNLMPS